MRNSTAAANGLTKLIAFASTAKVTLPGSSLLLVVLALAYSPVDNADRHVHASSWPNSCRVNFHRAVQKFLDDRRIVVARITNCPQSRSILATILGINLG